MTLSKQKAFALIELLACQPKPWRRQAQSAFTLIELLVVIAIISLLVSILLPTLQNAKQLALRVTCAANLRAQGTAMHLYLADNDQKFHSIDGCKEDKNWRWMLFYKVLLHNWTWDNRLWLYTESLEPYIETPMIYFCPGRPVDMYPLAGASDPWGNWDNVITYHGFKTDGNNNVLHTSKVRTMDGYRCWMYDILPPDSQLSYGGSHNAEGQNQLHPDCSVEWVDIDDDDVIRGLWSQ
ncbi:MAG: type II secretion system protein [Phycisphaerae bacterium]|nr:type II secretion system protein [Phycisphaerae bacterium]